MSTRERVRKLLDFPSHRNYIAKRFGLFVVVVFIIVACAPGVVSFPKGQYLDEFGNILNFEDGDKFTVKDPNGTFLVVEGQYTVDGDIIIFLEDEVCPPVEGVYRWSVGENGRLEFELIEENCEFRTFEAGLRPLP